MNVHVRWLKFVKVSDYVYCFSVTVVFSLTRIFFLYPTTRLTFILTSTRFSLSDFVVGMHIRLLSHRIPIDFRTTRIPMHAHYTRQEMRGTKKKHICIIHLSFFRLSEMFTLNLMCRLMNR